MGPAATADNLVVTEINYNPYDPEPEDPPGDYPNGFQYEFIELMNTSGVAVDLTTAKFTRGIDFNFTGSAVTKLNPDATEIVYSTYIGGSGNDVPEAMALDLNRAVYLTGATSSGDFPVTAGVVGPVASAGENAFVLKLEPGGAAPVYSTFVSGSAAGVRTSGVVADFVEAGREVESAAEMYLTGLLPAVVVEDDDDAARAAILLRKETAGRTCFLAKTHPAGAPAVGTASNGTSPVPDEVLRDGRVLGRLSDFLKTKGSANGFVDDRIGACELR